MKNRTGFTFLKEKQNGFTFLKKKQTGFTLIELLVSISIIAILTALLTANFIGARQRGRDGQRKANLYNLQSAFELYRADSGTYPASLPACGSALSSTSVTPTVYMQKIPCDPTNSGTYIYTYVASPTGCDNLTGSTSCAYYTIFTCLENREDSNKDSTKNSACSEASFTLTNP